ncbi:MAG: shikimate kinase [Bacillota bacterium]|nr:shikimate kinase [Bacillota bacterium]
MMYGLIGKPLGHSYSKVIHEMLGKYEYNLNELEPAQMKELIKSRNFKGLNVTIPYKKDVIPLCDRVTKLAGEIGAVNTLYFKDGQLWGHNTDYEGFLYASKRAGIQYCNKVVAILGTGGASLSALAAVKHEGCSEVYRVSRSSSDADCGIINYETLYSMAGHIQVIVNTTPVGTYPDNLHRLINLDEFSKLESVMDVIYNPFKTLLVQDAQARKLHVSNGLPMLVAQATAAAGYFLNAPGSFDKMNEKIIEALEEKLRNIVLIGMPGSGKSKVAKALSNITGKPFFDMDKEIENREGITIPEIFEKQGEKAFRDMETQVAQDLGKERGIIIATGGGSILRPQNVAALKQNGLVIHLVRPIDKLPTNGRPLSKDIDALRQMEKIRLPLYRRAADITLNNSRYLSRRKLEQYLLDKLPITKEKSYDNDK